MTGFFIGHQASSILLDICGFYTGLFIELIVTAFAPGASSQKIIISDTVSQLARFPVSSTLQISASKNIFSLEER